MRHRHQKSVSAITKVEAFERLNTNTIEVKLVLRFLDLSSADAFTRLTQEGDGEGSLFPGLKRPFHAIFERLHGDRDRGDL